MKRGGFVYYISNILLHIVNMSLSNILLISFSKIKALIEQNVKPIAIIKQV